MFQSWKFIFLIMFSVLLLTACGQNIDERASKGVKAASDAFYAHNIETNEEIDGTKFYKPIGFQVENDSDAQNIVLNKGKDTFILFINPNEKRDSKLYYDLLTADDKKNIIKEETFTEEETFGFAAIVQGENEDTAELIVSVGGTKMSTRTKEKNIESYMPKMMEVVQSIKK